MKEYHFCFFYVYNIYFVNFSVTNFTSEKQYCENLRFTTYEFNVIYMAADIMPFDISDLFKNLIFYRNISYVIVSVGYCVPCYCFPCVLCRLLLFSLGIVTLVIVSPGYWVPCCCYPWGELWFEMRCVRVYQDNSKIILK